MANTILAYDELNRLVRVDFSGTILTVRVPNNILTKPDLIVFLNNYSIKIDSLTSADLFGTVF